MVPGAPDSQNWPDRTVAGVPLLSPPSLPARRQSPLSCLRSWLPILASPPPPRPHSPGEGALHLHPEPVAASRVMLVRRQQPRRAGTLAVRSAGTGARRGGTSEVGAAWMPPAPAPGPRGGAVSRAAQRRASGSRGSPADCDGARRRSPPPRPGPPQPATGRPPGPSRSLPASLCSQLSPSPLSCSGTLSPDPTLRGKGSLQGTEGETPACQKPWV